MAVAIAALLMRWGIIPQHVAPQRESEMSAVTALATQLQGPWNAATLTRTSKRFPHFSGTFYSRSDQHRSHLHGNLAPRLLFHCCRSERHCFLLQDFLLCLKRMTPNLGTKVSPAALTPGKVLFTPHLIGDLGGIVNCWHLRFHLAAAPCSSLRH